MWELYDALVEGIPPGIRVADFACGVSWTYVRTAESMGIAATVKIFDRPPLRKGPVIGADLRDIAALSKSWNLVEASLGVAAINCWYNAPARMQALGLLPPDYLSLPPALRPGTREDREAFFSSAGHVRGKKVAVIGRFAHLERMFSGICDLTVLERSPGKSDYIDSACEYLLAEQDCVFITGMTLANKTLERLLAAAAGTEVTLVGPSSPMSESLFGFGVSHISGFTATDQDDMVDRIRRGTAHRVFSGGYMVSMSSSPAGQHTES